MNILGTTVPTMIYIITKMGLVALLRLGVQQEYK